MRDCIPRLQDIIGLEVDNHDPAEGFGWLIHGQLEFGWDRLSTHCFYEHELLEPQNGN